jgi:predicted Zn finger-like uncharacterized protein
LFTVCPKCTLTLVVTTVDLRAGQGYVRCGRCANVFNALIALREGEPGATASDSANRRLQETAPKPSVEPALGSGVAMDLEPEPLIAAGSEVAENEEGSLEFDAIGTDVSEIFIQPPTDDRDIGSGSYEAVVLSEEDASEAEPVLEVPEPAHTDTIASDDWSLLDDEPETPTADDIVSTQETSVSDPPWVEEMFAEAEAESYRARTSEHVTLESGADELEPAVVQAARGSTGAAAPSDTAIEPLLIPPVKLRPSWQHVSGVAALLLLLVLQILHFNRQNLALSSTFGPAASKVYGWFGITLIPRWDLTAYSVKQLGADAEGSDGTRLRVRLSVHNESSRAQPMPLVRLTLRDRFGRAVATRDLEPAEYLPKRESMQRLLEPDQRIDAEVHVIDPEKAAYGFEIDACLRSESGGIGCANDARRRAAS